MKIKGDWQEVVDDARSTVHKPPLGHEPSAKFKRGMLMAEHSPIRDIMVKWNWFGIPSWIATHWSRHKFEKFISTQRSDKTGIPRKELPQDAPVNFKGDANVQQLIDAWRKRLCFQASPETREYAEDFKVTLRNTEPEIADVLVPNCCYRGGCCEKGISTKKCDFYDKLCEQIPELKTTDLQARYDAYNRWFYSAHQPKEPLILLAGPSGCGKSTVAKILEEKYHLRSLKSFTTRPRRTPDEDTHTFIGEDVFKTYQYWGDIIAETEINGYHYGATKKMADEADVYVIDPAGVESMPPLYKHERHAVYVWIECSPKTCAERMWDRGTPQEIEGRDAADRKLREDNEWLQISCKIPTYEVANDGDPADCADEVYQIFVKETKMN